MKDYNNRFQGGGGGFNRGGGGDRRPGGFNRGGRDGGRPVEMFKATCAECGNMAEVPFKPTGDKPVLCKDCFSASRDRNDRREFSRPERSNFQDRNRDFGDRRPAPGMGGDTRKMQEQIDMINKKLDKVLKALNVEDHYEKRDIFRAAEKPLTPKKPRHARPDDGALKKAVEDAAALEE